jgi:hypothetical protein
LQVRLFIDPASNLAATVESARKITHQQNNRPGNFLGIFSEVHTGLLARSPDRASMNVLRASQFL